MFKRFTSIAFVLSLVLFGEGVVFGHGPAVLGGYDLSKIAVATLDNLKAKEAISEDQYLDLSKLVVREPADPLVWGSSYIDLYARLGVLLAENGTVTQEELAAVEGEAGSSGGAKIAGLNPVVLAAGFLDILAKEGLISLPEAQSILDSARQK